MDRKLRDILDSMPEKPPRSCLEPHRALIAELRRRKRTYREIINILAEKCDLRVSVSTLHDFVRLRARPARKARQDRRLTKPGIARKSQVPSTTVQKQKSSTSDDVRRRISDIKQRSAATKPYPAQRFDYDPGEPLRLPGEARER